MLIHLYPSLKNRRFVIQASLGAFALGHFFFNLRHMDPSS
jgi:hypothetical protein